MLSALHKLSFDGKIDCRYAHMLFMFAEQIENMCEEFDSNDGWENSQSSDPAMLELEREKLEARIQRIDETLAAHENNLPAS
jgi:hypothetical protein